MKTTRRSFFAAMLAPLMAKVLPKPALAAVPDPKPAMQAARDYYVIEWPVTARYWSCGGVYTETLKAYIPLAMHPIVSVDKVWIEGCEMFPAGGIVNNDRPYVVGEHAPETILPRLGYSADCRWPLSDAPCVLSNWPGPLQPVAPLTDTPRTADQTTRECVEHVELARRET